MWLGFLSMVPPTYLQQKKKLTEVINMQQPIPWSDTGKNCNVDFDLTNSPINILSHLLQ